MKRKLGLRSVQLLSSRERWLLLLEWIYLFHIFRNISLVVYAGILGIVYIIAFGLNVTNSQRLKKLGLLESIFIVSYTLVMIVTFFSGLSLEEVAYSIARFIIVYALFVLFIFCRGRLSNHFIELAYYSYVIFIVLSAISLYYQMIFGPITFFAPVLQREGLNRYASLCGSVTAYGTLGAIGLIILIYKREMFTRAQYILYFFIIVGAMFVSLSKAAMVNLVLVIGWFVLSRLRKEKKFYKRFWLIMIMIGIVIFISGLFFVPNSLITKYATTAINYVIANKDSRFSTTGDLKERLFSIPMYTYNYNNMSPIDFVFGKGLMIMSGAVGLVSYPMCHNNYFEMLFTGGYLYLFSFIGLFYRAYKNSHNKSMVLMISIIAATNMMIGAFQITQPVLGVFLALYLIADKVSDSGKKSNF